MGGGTVARLMTALAVPRRGGVAIGTGDDLARPGDPARKAVAAREDDPEACSWLALRDVYREQAARGVPEAIVGLARIEEGRWPRSGRPRVR
ncbi:MAG: hypothetical protein ACHQ02_08300 [Candidatus Limnocylindrales bacterium]